MDWKLTDAGKRLKEVVDFATNNGPQLLTQGDDVVAVVLSRSEYERLTHEPIQPSDQKPRKDFLEHLRSAPKLTDEELKVFERDKSLPRIPAFDEE